MTKSSVLALAIGALAGAAMLPHLPIEPRERPLEWVEARFDFSDPPRYRLFGYERWRFRYEPRIEHANVRFE